MSRGDNSRRNDNRGARRGRTLSLERLEERQLLSALGLVEVGAQPTGSLDGKVVYLHPGHGYVANNLGSGAWGTQRPLLHEMVEDMGNKDQADIFADYLFNSGATVVPLRPVGHQTNEAVLDNDDPQVSFTGGWSDSTAGTYFGAAGDVPYRFATTSATETATAVYRPVLPASGYYPVYCWTTSGGNRAADQLYRVHHAGGATEVTVNHRMVGNGLVYLGSYYFNAGDEGYVEISNRSSEAGRVVVADMIRFGNGVGDINRGGGVSGYSREDEAGLYWVQWHVDRSQGISSTEYRTDPDDREATKTFAPRYAEYMNREQEGTLADRVFVSFHSNAGGGRGTIALHNTGNGGDTPNQLLLAQHLGSEVNDDLVAQAGQFEHNWADRGSNITYAAGFNFGEISNAYAQSEFDATIVEVAFHDSQLDAELLRAAGVRDAVARATYQGLADYFRAVDSGATPNVDLPASVTGVSATRSGPGSVTIRWEPPAANSYLGDAATGYVIYASTNGYAFDGGTLVTGGGATSQTLVGLDPDQTYYFKVVAQNQGGHSPGSEVVAVAPVQDPQTRVLVVNGFDRLDRSQNPEETHYLGGTLDRVRPRESNAYDYAVSLASAIAAASSDPVAIDTSANEAVITGQVLLADYDAVFWILGEESTAGSTFDNSEQGLVDAYLAGGGSLFVSGSEIAWDLDAQDNGRAFYNDSLKATYTADDADSYQVVGAAGSIFGGLDFAFDDGSLIYDADSPDVISPVGGALAALNYANGAGVAAVQYNDGARKVVTLAFPFETISAQADRVAVMQRVLDYFELDGDSIPAEVIDRVLDNDDGPPVYADAGGWITSSDPGYQGGTYRFNLLGAQATAQWTTQAPRAGVAQVFVQYEDGANRATGAHFHVNSTVDTLSRDVDQTTSGSQWVFLGSLAVDSGPLVVTLDAGASTGQQFSLVVADAVRVVMNLPTTPDADFNGDYRVDALDYAVWREQAGQQVPQGTGGDANHDGRVDQDDFQVWLNQYGAVRTPPAPILASPQQSFGGASPGGAMQVFAMASAEQSTALAPKPMVRESEASSRLSPSPQPIKAWLQASQDPSHGLTQTERAPLPRLATDTAQQEEREAAFASIQDDSQGVDRSVSRILESPLHRVTSR